MAIGELILGAVIGLGGSILGSYAAHRYQEHRDCESRRLRTNNVLLAISTEIESNGARYRDTLRRVLFEVFPEGVPVKCIFHESSNGINAYRENVGLITTEIATQEIVSNIIELDQIWKSLSGSFQINNWYLERAEKGAENEAHLIRHATTIRKTYVELEEKAASLLNQIKCHLLSSKPATFSLFPEDWIRLE